MSRSPPNARSTETATSDGAESAEPEGQGGRWRLRVVPDAGWLGDPARVFPVFIDPTVALGPARDCILAKDLASTALCGSTINVLQAGRRNWTNKRRSVLDFDLSAIPATAAIQHANVELYLMKTQTTNPSLEASYDMFRTAVGFTGSATWNSSGYGPWSAGSPTGARLDRVTTKGQVAGWRYWNVADAIRAWHYDDVKQTGFVLKQAGAETVNTRLSFHSAYTSQPARAPNLNIIYGESANPTAAAGERDHFEFTTRELSDRMEAKVNIGTGNFLLSARDMSIKGVAGWDMAMTRTYNSATFDTGVGSMGLGWTTMFGGSIRLEFPQQASGGGKDKVWFWGPSGYRVVFEKDGSPDGFDRPEPGLNGDLVKTAQGYRLEWFDQSVYVFDEQGRLQVTRDSKGNELNFNYTQDPTANPTKVVKVIDTRGRSMTMDYDSTGSVITAVTARKPDNTPMMGWSYTYAQGPLGAVLTSSELSSSMTPRSGAPRPLMMRMWARRPRMATPTARC